VSTLISFSLIVSFLPNELPDIMNYGSYLSVVCPWAGSSSKTRSSGKWTGLRLLLGLVDAESGSTVKCDDD